MGRSAWMFGGCFLLISLACSGLGSVDGKIRGDELADLIATEDAPDADEESAAKTMPNPQPLADETVKPAKEKTVEKSEGPVAQKRTQMGTLSSARSASFVMKGSGGEMPSVGVTGTVLKKVDKQMGSMSFSAWLQIAEVTVTKVKGESITLKIDKRLSEITVNGKKTNHFQPGSQLKLEWTE